MTAKTGSGRLAMFMLAACAVMSAGVADADVLTNKVVMTNNATMDYSPYWTTQHLFNATASAGGTISGTSNGWYDAGMTVSNTATPASHKLFWYWTGVPNSETNKASAVWTLDQPYTNATAYFKDDSHTLTVISPYGSASPGTVSNMLHGSISTQTINSVHDLGNGSRMLLKAPYFNLDGTTTTP